MNQKSSHGQAYESAVTTHKRADMFPSDSMCFANVVRPNFRGSSCQTHKHTRVQQRAKRAEMEMGEPTCSRRMRSRIALSRSSFCKQLSWKLLRRKIIFLKSVSAKNMNSAGLIREHALTLSLRPCAEPPAAAPESLPPHPAAAAQQRLCRRRQQRPRAVPRAVFQMRWPTPRAA